MRKAGQKHVIDRASQHAALHPESRLCAFDLCIGLAKKVIDRASQNREYTVGAVCRVQGIDSFKQSVR
jgi:hypothetical protein